MSNINKAYKNIFIHVPKTAGTSMENMDFIGGNSHASAKILKEIAGDAIWEKYFTWGFIRNPLERFVSAFFHTPKTHYFPQNNKGFEEFIHYMYAMKLDPKGALTGAGHHHHHFTPQHYFLCDEEDNILVQFVGKFSELQLHWEEVSLKLTHTVYELPHERQSNHAHYSAYYGDSRLIEMVKELYAKDYQILGVL